LLRHVLEVCSMKNRLETPAVSHWNFKITKTNTKPVTAVCTAELVTLSKHVTVSDGQTKWVEYNSAPSQLLLKG